MCDWQRVETPVEDRKVTIDSDSNNPCSNPGRAYDICLYYCRTYVFHVFIGISLTTDQLKSRLNR